MAMRWLSLVLVLLLGLVQAGLWLGDGGLSHVMKLQQQLRDKQRQNAEQKATNARLMAEVDDLKRGLEMVEERARSELGMLKADEIFVQYAVNSAANSAGYSPANSAAMGGMAGPGLPGGGFSASRAPGAPGTTGTAGAPGATGAPGTSGRQP